ncbi:hypothetical protein OROMI_033042 [Orobanche minor]
METDPTDPNDPNGPTLANPDELKLQTAGDDEVLPLHTTQTLEHEISENPTGEDDFQLLIQGDFHTAQSLTDSYLLQNPTAEDDLQAELRHFLEEKDRDELLETWGPLHPPSPQEGIEIIDLKFSIKPRLQGIERNRALVMGALSALGIDLTILGQLNRSSSINRSRTRNRG